jgi:Fe-S-cluster-containing dehydrogenase component
MCNKEFWTTQGRVDVGKDKYCSKECGYEARKKLPRQLTCKVCKKAYEYIGDSSKDYQARYCSEECLKSEHPRANWHKRQLRQY